MRKISNIGKDLLNGNDLMGYDHIQENRSIVNIDDAKFYYTECGMAKVLQESCKWSP